MIEHVRVASLGTDALGEIHQRIVRDLSAVAAQCDHVWIIGHSQGGYLVHRVLSTEDSTRWPTARNFTGLASGLRPIHLLSTRQGRRWLASGWIALAGGIAGAIGLILALEPGGLINTDGSRRQLALLLLSLADPRALLDGGETSAQLLTGFLPTEWTALPFLILGVVLTIVSLRLASAAKEEPPEIKPVDARIGWEELTSPSDLVGSMSIPEIPASVISRTIPSLRQPILDHLLRSYFFETSVFRFEVARWMFRSTEDTRTLRDVEALTSDLIDLSERTYRLRFVVQAVILFVLVLIPVAIFGRPLLETAKAIAPWAIAAALVNALIAALWWHRGSRRRVRAFEQATKAQTQFEPVRPLGRRSWAIAMTAAIAFMLAFGGLGIILYAGVMMNRVGDETRGAVYLTMGTSGPFLLGSAAVAFVALCLAMIALRGVRAALAISLLLTIYSFGPLLTTNVAWIELGVPGVWIPTMSVVLLIVAILGSGRITAPQSTP